MTRLPSPIVVLIAASIAIAALHLPIETIGTRFGGIPQHLPAFAWPDISLSTLRNLVAPTITIALLGAIESLLSARVADAQIDDRHDPNQELMAQGIANVVAPFFGGIPATGAIARTATNIRSGGRTPIAGMIHAVTLLVIVLAAAPLAQYVPLAALSAVLMIVAINMGDWHAFRDLRKYSIPYRTVLLSTFVITVVFDLTVAIEVGLVLAAFLFMHRMSEVVAMQSNVSLVEEDTDDFDARNEPSQRAQLPAGVEAFQISGPLFFAVANRLDDVLNQFPVAPRVFILRLRLVPLIDASGVGALRQMLGRCARNGTRVILSGLREQPRAILAQMGVNPDGDRLQFAVNFADAVALSVRSEAPSAGLV